MFYFIHTRLYLPSCSVPAETEPSSPEPEPEREPLLPLPTVANGAEAAISEAVKNLPDDIAEKPLKGNSAHQDDASSTSSSAKSRSRSKSYSRSHSRSKSRSRSPRNRSRSPRNRRRSYSRSPRRRRYVAFMHLILHIDRGYTNITHSFWRSHPVYSLSLSFLCFYTT